MTEEIRDQEMEKLKQELESLREKLAAFAAAGRGQTGPGSSGASYTGASDQAGSDWESIREALDSAQVRGTKTLKDLSAHIERHPVGSAVAAFGLGFLIARLLSGGRRS